VKSDDANLKPQYRMPRVFGALPGPRNVPRDKRHLPNDQHNLTIAITALTDPDRLSELLPPACALEGEPLLTVTMTYMSNIGWLAGHGYAVLSVGFSIAHVSPARGKLTGSFKPVMWENLADPIVTGREELGFAKIFADLPAPMLVGNRLTALAAWRDFRFFDLEVAELADAPPVASKPEGSFHYKYVPKTGALSASDVDYLEYAPPDAASTGYAALRVTRLRRGNGSFTFSRTRWEDIPFQYPIINALAELPVLEVRSATVIDSVAEGVIGDPSGGSLAEVD
jgi:Acetoacetate decarboxylase (ADC)